MSTQLTIKKELEQYGMHFSQGGIIREEFTYNPIPVSEEVIQGFELAEEITSKQRKMDINDAYAINREFKRIDTILTTTPIPEHKLPGIKKRELIDKFKKTRPITDSENNTGLQLTIIRNSSDLMKAITGVSEMLNLPSTSEAKTALQEYVSGFQIPCKVVEKLGLPSSNLIQLARINYQP